jgi:hypothetical protein
VLQPVRLHQLLGQLSAQPVLRETVDPLNIYHRARKPQTMSVHSAFHPYCHLMLIGILIWIQLADGRADQVSIEWTP